MQLVCDLLPWALLIHLALAVWFYGADTLKSGPVQLPIHSWEVMYQKFTGRTLAFDKIDLLPKLRRQAAFPVALLLFILVVAKLGWKLFGRFLKDVLGYGVCVFVSAPSRIPCCVYFIGNAPLL